MSSVNSLVDRYIEKRAQVDPALVHAMIGTGLGASAGYLLGDRKDRQKRLVGTILSGGLVGGAAYGLKSYAQNAPAMGAVRPSLLDTPLEFKKPRGPGLGEIVDRAAEAIENSTGRGTRFVSGFFTPKLLSKLKRYKNIAPPNTSWGAGNTVPPDTWGFLTGLRNTARSAKKFLSTKQVAPAFSAPNAGKLGLSRDLKKVVEVWKKFKAGDPLKPALRIRSLKGGTVSGVSGTVAAFLPELLRAIPGLDVAKDKANMGAVLELVNGLIADKIPPEKIVEYIKGQVTNPHIQEQIVNLVNSQRK